MNFQTNIENTLINRFLGTTAEMTRNIVVLERELDWCRVWGKQHADTPAYRKALKAKLQECKAELTAMYEAGK